MFSRIEGGVAAKGVEPAEGRGASWRRFTRQCGWAGLFASFAATSGCSGGREIIATITLEAGAIDARDAATTCDRPEFYNAPDMGLDLYFIIDHSDSFGGTQWGVLYSWLSNLRLAPQGPLDAGSPIGEFDGIGVGFTVYPLAPVPKSCVDACPVSPNCQCLERCDCERAFDPQGNCECRRGPESCNDADYGPILEIERLSEGLLPRTLANVGPPDGATTLGPALSGSLDHRQAWETERPDRPLIQILVAGDLDPLACSHDSVSDIEKLLSGLGKPKMYVVAIDDMDNANDYQRLAAVGHTEAPDFFSTFRPSPTNPFVGLIRKIRAEDGRCEYLLPPAPNFDRTKVNLTNASDEQPFRHVQSSNDCRRDPQGWYYDDPMQPTRVMACEGACQTLRTAGARIQLGCPTVTAVDAGR